MTRDLAAFITMAVFITAVGLVLPDFAALIH